MGKFSKKFFILLAITLSFFIGKKTFSAAINNFDVFFSEICWMGGLNSTADEWIELKNNTSAPIQIDNWLIKSAVTSFKISLSGTIPANGFFLLERTDDDSVPELKADQIYTGALSNTSEKLQLLSPDGTMIDQYDATAGWNAGDNSTKQTAERVDQSTWITSTLPGGTPQNSLTNTTPTTETKTPVTENNINQSTGSRDAIYSGDILISEFVSDPDEDDGEWIELYNTTPRIISLGGWSLADGKDTKTALSGTINANDFLVIENPQGKLNNDGDLIVLKDENNVIIDQVAYGNFADGQLDDNAPAAAKPNSVARLTENYNTRNNSADFQITSTPTKGNANLLNSSATDDAPFKEKVTSSPSSPLIISEILPDPIDTDYENEFIELYNSGKSEINLKLFRLENKAGQKFILPDKVLKAGTYWAFFRKETSIVMNNQTDTVKLIQIDSEKTVQTLTYKNALAGMSYNLLINEKGATKNWSWENSPTPGQPNIIKKINQAPQISFTVPDKSLVGQPVFGDSSDTFDLENDKLSYLWDFGDGTTIALPNAEHTYQKTGTYKIILTASDKENSSNLEKKIIISDLSQVVAEQTVSPISETNYSLIFNEIFPAPEKNEEEWLELYNPGEKKINLKGWSIKDKSQTKYSFPDDIWLNGKNYFLLKKSVSKISLNNDGEYLQLLGPEKNLVDEVDYSNAPSAQAYARGQNGKWFWTAQATPQSENIIEYESSLADPQFLSINTNSNINNETDNTAEFQVGKSLTIQGIVTVLPNIFSSQYFYITGSSSLQIYSSKKDFPVLKIGDQIEVSGELSKINNEWRLKTKTSDDLKILAHDQALPKQTIACGEIDESLLGQLIETGGEIVSKKSTTLTIDDGTGELIVNIKTGTGIDLKKYQEGDFISLTGILVDTKSGLRLLPRNEADININKSASGKVQGVAEAAETLNLPERSQDKKIFSYLIVTLIASNIILLILLFKRKS